MDLGESRKEKMGGLSFDAVKPASCETSPIIKSFSPRKEISQEAIEKKLKEAEERRMPKIEAAKARRVLHISGIPHDVTEGEIIQLGLPFGLMTNLVISRKKNQALLEMADISTAESMLKYYAERPPEIRGHTVHFEFSTYVNLITDHNWGQNLNGQNVYNSCCTLRTDYTKLQALVVKFNNDKTCDHTKPYVPSGKQQQQQKANPESVNDGLLGSFGSVFGGLKPKMVNVGVMNGLSRLGVMVNMDAFCRLGGIGGPRVMGEKGGKEPVDGDSDEDNTESDNRDGGKDGNNEETKPTNTDRNQNNDDAFELDGNDEAAGGEGGGPPSSDSGDDPEDTLDNDLTDIVTVHKALVLMPIRISRRVLRTRNSNPVLFWGSSAIAMRVRVFFGHEITVNKLNAFFVSDIANETSQTLSETIQIAVNAVPSLLIILGLDALKSLHKEILQHLVGFESQRQLITVIATATDVGAIDDGLLKKFYRIHTPVEFDDPANSPA